jgi:hypothetical protein
MVLPRVALTAEEVAAAAGQQATVFQELASALVEIRQPILGFPSAQALRRFFAARREFITDGLMAYDSGSDFCFTPWSGLGDTVRRNDPSAAKRYRRRTVRS